MMIIALLTIQREMTEQFREYEHQVATIMASYGGRIERTVVVRAPAEDPVFQELHLVYFPSSEAWAAYRWDVRYRALAPVRERVVLTSDVMLGDDGPTYGA